MNISIYLAVLLFTVGPCVMGCTTGALRLTGSSSGVLQICKYNQWKAVCSEDWGHLDSAVACRQLGYDGGYTNSTMSSNTLTVDPVEYHCSGRESTLQSCDKQTRSWCSITSVANIVCLRRNASDPCSSGDIRLWGGETEYEGNIEICTDHGVWSAVCDTYWDTADAVVACKQLNYPRSIAVPYQYSAFGQRVQPAEYGGLYCQGTESTLQSCTISTSFVRYCYSRLAYCHQGRHAGVKCIPRTAAVCKNGDVRLTGGYSENNGYAEICIDGAWTGICQQRHDPHITNLICKHMGYTRYTIIDPILLPSSTEMQAYVPTRGYWCSSESSVLLDCVYNSTTYGIKYVNPTCRPHASLCCPNATCSLQTTPPTDYIEHFTLRFGNAAATLILSRHSEDLQGLLEDIQDRVIRGISEECGCHFDTSTLKDGSFSFGETIAYNGRVSGVNEQDAAGLWFHLKSSIEKSPQILFRKAGIYLNVTFHNT